MYSAWGSKLPQHKHNYSPPDTDIIYWFDWCFLPYRRIFQLYNASHPKSWQKARQYSGLGDGGGRFITIFRLLRDPVIKMSGVADLKGTSWHDYLSNFKSADNENNSISYKKNKIKCSETKGCHAHQLHTSQGMQSHWITSLETLTYNECVSHVVECRRLSSALLNFPTT